MVTTKTTQELVSDVKVQFVQNVEGFNDMNIGSALDLYTTAMCQELEVYYTQLQTLENNAFIDTSTGSYLDQLGSEAGVTRKTGTQSAGYITFYRTSPAASDFVIPSGSQVSTQPNSTETQYVFQTTADATFSAVITGETKTFVSGIYDYKLSSRLISSMTSVTGTASSAAKTFVLNTDYQLVSVTNSDVADTSTITLIESCDAITGWAATGASSTTPYVTSTKQEGSYSLVLDKNLTTGAIAGFTKTLGSTKDLSLYKSYVYAYIADTTTLNKIKYVNIYLGINGSVSNAFKFVFPKSVLAVGWNKLTLDYLNATTLLGIPNIGVINHLKFEYETNNSSDTTSGVIFMDFWHMVSTESYTGNIIRFLTSGTVPDTNTVVTSAYVPLSKDILCTSVIVGTGNNVTVNKINYKISNLVNIDNVNNYVSMTGGTNIEDDSTYRTRILSGSTLNDVATVSAITSNVTALNFIANAAVTDLPTINTTNEAIVYSSAQAEYSVINKVAIDDATFKISNTSGGAANYTKGTDYFINSKQNIEWISTGSKPSNGATFYVTYNSKRLGYFNILVSGMGGALTPAQLTTVQTTIDSVKSAGILYNLSQPTSVPVAVTATITAKTGYSTATAILAATTAITNYINSLGIGIGASVQYSSVVTAIMEQASIANVNVSDIGGGGKNDYTISSSQKASNGTHVVS